jgi:hypothetical protein
MTNYARMYRFGITPWERYATAAASSIAVRLDHEETGRSRPLGRALDLGCGRGLYTLLMLSFGPSRWRRLVGGVSQEEIETAFAGWEMLASEPANTAGLGWPMNKTAPRWYRLGRSA